MDLDHLKQLVETAIAECELLNDLGPRYAELEAYVFGHADARPVPMILTCPSCSERHIEGALAAKSHHTHACQSCVMVWRPAIVPTCGVRFLPGFKDP